MNSGIKKFGQFVGSKVETSPQKARSLLKAAYRVSGLQMKYFPKRQLLPSQRYLSMTCNEAIQRPLRNPQRSAVVNVFMPCEVLHAMDIAPQFTEGLACYINGAGCERAFIEFAEKWGVPASYCSYHKILIGATLSGVLPKPRFIVNTTLACDANTSTFRLLSKHLSIPQFTVDVPNTNSEQAAGYVAAQLQEMTNFIEKIMGQRLDGEKLKKTIRRGNTSIRLHKAYYEELANKFLPNELTSEMYKIFHSHVLLGTKQGERYFKLLLDDVKKAQAKDGGIRLLWIHTMPFWQDSFKDLLNFSSRYQIIGCDLNFDSMIEVDENKPFEGMAQRLLLNTFGGVLQNRAGKALEMAKTLNVDGVVFFCHWGCKQTLGGGQLMKSVFESADIPMLTLDGDGCDRNNVNDGQMLTRMQAFLEMLEAGKW